MGRKRHKYNKEENNEVLETNNSIKLEGYDKNSTAASSGTNALMIQPGEHRVKKKIVKNNLPKRLNKKEKKKLQRVLDQKKKRENREELMSKLASVQINPNQLAMMDSVAHIGTKNSKLTALAKRPVLQAGLQKAIDNLDEEELSLKIEQEMTSRKGKRRKRTKNKHSKKKKVDGTVEEEESEDEEDEEDEEEINEMAEIEAAEEEDSDDDTEDAEEKSDQKEDKPNQKPTEIKKPEKSISLAEKAAQKPIESKTYVHLDRTTKVQEARLRLPILAEEHEIMEAITKNDVIIICGETGSGKTTQVPQFLYEAGYARNGLIGVTEPRRVAAVSMANRVAHEMNLSTSKISYQIRYDSSVTDETEMKFMTDGVLQREIKADFLLSKYSAIVLDEAHERTANTDFLIGCLSRVVRVRRKKENLKPLKLVIMSATLRVEDFTENLNLFDPKPDVIKIDVRQFDVKVHFDRNTPGCYEEGKIDDHANSLAYMRAAYRKVCKIHREQPRGGILVFVTGKQEVHQLITKLSKTFPREMPKEEPKAKEMPEIRLEDFSNMKDDDKDDDNDEKKQKTNELYVSDDDEDGAGVGNSDDEGDDADYLISKENDKLNPMHVLPLYSMLPPHKQKLVFQPPPEGTRLCVVATNVAETSLTIPGIKYVVDTGKVKRRIYDNTTGVSTFRVTWTSQASANQRAGRAGRTSDGHAYRLYSSRMFADEFEKFDQAEILAKPVSSLVLQLKSMGIDRVVNFPFPTPPSEEALKSAENILISLGAVHQPDASQLKNNKQKKLAQFSGKISDLGKLMSNFPLNPRYSKMISAAIQNKLNGKDDVIQYVIIIVAALTVGEIFLPCSTVADEIELKEGSKKAKPKSALAEKKASLSGKWEENRKFGDMMAILGAIGAVSCQDGAKRSEFIHNFSLRWKAIEEVMKLRRQLTNIVNCQCQLVRNGINVDLNPQINAPTTTQLRSLRMIVFSALGDHVAKLCPPCTSDDVKVKRRMKNAYECTEIEDKVFVHPDSCLLRDGAVPEFVCFQDLCEVVNSRGEKRVYMRDVCAVDPEWMNDVCPTFCTNSPPLEQPEPRYDPLTGEIVCHVTITYGRRSWPLGAQQIVHPHTLHKYKLFACALLKGDVFKPLKKLSLRPGLLPDFLLKPYWKLLKEKGRILEKLQEKQVHNRDKLAQVWRQEPTYLQKEFMEWINDSCYDRLVLSWPPIGDN